MPQVIILFSLYKSLYIDAYGLYKRDWIDGYGGVTFFTSLVSAGKGIATLLKEGPLKLVPSQGLLGGYCQIGFILVFVNVVATLVGKIMVFSVLFAFAIVLSGFQVACLAFLPNLIFVR